MSASHFVLIIFICLVWGFTFVAGKAGVNEIPPVFFTGLRYLLLAVVLLPWLKPMRGQMGKIAVVAVTMGSLHFALFYGGLAVSDNVSVVAITVQLGTPFATLLSIVFLGEQIGWRRWLGILMAFSGVVLVGFDERLLDERIGLALVAAAAFIGAIGMVVMRRMQNVGVFQLQSWIAMLSWPMLFLASALLEGGQIEAARTASIEAWGGVLYTALGASLIGHAGMFYLLQRYEVTLVSPITLLAPIFGVLFGIVIWGDIVTPAMLVGGAITMAGVLIIVRRSKKGVAGSAPLTTPGGGVRSRTP